MYVRIMSAAREQTFMVRSKSGPFLRHSIYYEGASEEPVTVEYRRENVYTAGKRESATPTDAIGGHRRKISSKDDVAAELWERQSDANIEWAWFQFVERTRVPSLVPLQRPRSITIGLHRPI